MLLRKKWLRERYKLLVILRRRHLFYVLSIFSGVLSAVVVALDIWISATMIQNPAFFGLSLFFIGTILHISLLLLLSIDFKERRIGEFIDPLFRGIIIPKGELLKYLFLAGLSNAIASISYFVIIAELPDPSAVIPFTNLITGYLLIGDLLIEKERPAIIEIQSIFMVVFGALLVNLSGGEIDLIGLILVLGPLNLGSFGYIFFQKKARSLKNGTSYYDSINLRVWSLIFTSAIFIVTMPLIVRSISIIVESFKVALRFYLPLALDMLVTFFAYVLYIRALGLGKMSIVNALSSISVVISIPLTIILSIFIPSIYFLQIDLVTLLIKLIGIILMFIGIVSLSLSEVTAYIFIKVRKRKSMDILKELLRIDGIEYASATAGRYDLIVRVRLRTLGKAYEKIVDKLSKINGIEDFIWLSTLKEWERI